MNEFEPQEKAPNDIYEYDKSTKSPSRMQAALVATAGFVIFGGLIGGGAFAMNGGLPGLVPGGSNAPAAANIDPSATPAGSSSVDPSAPSSDSNGTDPVAIPSDSASVDPVAPSASASVDPAAPSESAAPVATQIVVPPVFNHKGDDEKENEGAKSAKHTKKPKASPTATGAPTFGSDDSESGDDN